MVSDGEVNVDVGNDEIVAMNDAEVADGSNVLMLKIVRIVDIGLVVCVAATGLLYEEVLVTVSNELTVEIAVLGD